MTLFLQERSVQIGGMEVEFHTEGCILTADRKRFLS